ncbi:MAG: hypothetical protein K2X04_05365 [Burkholderiales bacterium]|nr:hypothetical protein [Burkholderiales bacterium]
MKFDYLFKNRYIILSILFAFFVICNVNFSSIHMWSLIIHNDNPAFILGKARDIRSDEWATNLTWQMSQVYNNFKVINYMSIFSGFNTIIGQYQASWSLENLGRPLNWGFLMFGASRGLSWYWCAKYVLLILSSIEFLYFLTNDKKIALLGSIIITYAPGLQWWFSNYLPDLIISFQFIVVLLYRMLKQNMVFYKILCAIGILLFSIGFIFVIYPPWQIPLLYIMLLLSLLILYYNRPQKIDILFIVFILLVDVFIIFMFYEQSVVDIGLISNTIYPGKRFASSGGVNLPGMFNYLNNLVTPFNGSPTYLNQCELSNFWMIFPIFPFLCFSIPSKLRGKYFNLLLSIDLFILMFMLVPNLGNDIIYKYTLLSNIPSNRLLVIFGLINTYLFVLFINASKKVNFNNRLKYINLTTWLYVCLYCSYTEIYSNMKIWIFISIGLMWFISHLLVIKKYNLSLSIMVVISIVTGATINPITVGIGDLYNSALSKKINEIRIVNPRAIWVGNSNAGYGEYLLAQGVYAYNSVKFYPDFEQWKSLDPNGKYRNVYNRYAHIIVNINNDKTNFILNQADLFTLNLSCASLVNSTNIEYILSPSLLECSQIELVSDVNGFYIYHVHRKI